MLHYVTSSEARLFHQMNESPPQMRNGRFRRWQDREGRSSKAWKRRKSWLIPDDQRRIKPTTKMSCNVWECKLIAIMSSRLFSIRINKFDEINPIWCCDAQTRGIARLEEMWSKLFQYFSKMIVGQAANNGKSVMHQNVLDVRSFGRLGMPTLSHFLIWHHCRKQKNDLQCTSTVWKHFVRDHQSNRRRTNSFLFSKLSFIIHRK